MQYADDLDRILTDPIQRKVIANDELADTRRYVVAWRP